MARARAGTEGEGAETTVDVEAAATFKVTPTMKLRLSQRYENVDSEVGYDYTRNTTMLTALKEF